jgi:DNA-binding Lrp family transcriptional regulator
MSAAQEKLPERLGRALRALSEGYKEILRKGCIKDEASIVSHAATVYDMSKLMAYLLGTECEEQVARSLEVSSEELRRVAEHLGTENKEDRRRLLIELVALESMLYQVTTHCLGLEN